MKTIPIAIACFLLASCGGLELPGGLTGSARAVYYDELSPDNSRTNPRAKLVTVIGIERAITVDPESPK